MKMNTDTLTIREMCDAFDVTPRTLRLRAAVPRAGRPKALVYQA